MIRSITNYETTSSYMQLETAKKTKRSRRQNKSKNTTEIAHDKPVADTPVVRKSEIDIHSITPCYPPPVFTFREGRSLWVISDALPRQNFWTKAPPEDIGLIIDHPEYNLYRYQHQEFKPSPQRVANIVAKIGRLQHGEYQYEVGMCITRKLGVITGRKEDAHRVINEMISRYQKTSTGIIARKRYEDRIQSQDLQDIVKPALSIKPDHGTLVICDAEYETGRWDEILLEGIERCDWVSALFYSAEFAKKGWCEVWDSTKQNEICDGIKIAEGSFLEEYVPKPQQRTTQDEFMLPLSGRGTLVSAGMVAPTLPPKAIEVLRLISVLRYARIRTDAATLADYIERKSQSTNPEQNIIAVLRTAAMILGTTADNSPRIYEDEEGNWVHTMPVAKIDFGDTDVLENYRWYTQLSSYIPKMFNR